MLLRDLSWKPREEARFYDYTGFRLDSGDVIYVEIYVGDRPAAPDYFGVIFVPGATSVDDIARLGLPANTNWIGHRCATEFEAQAVIDHYVALYGATNVKN